LIRRSQASIDATISTIFAPVGDITGHGSTALALSAPRVGGKSALLAVKA
jgi:hypothetical protein